MSQTTRANALGRLVAARELKHLVHTLRDIGAVTASGLWGSSTAAVVAAIETELHRPVVLICGHLDEADDLADDIELFVGRRPDVLPALEIGGSLGRVSEEQVSNRLQLITRLAARQQAAEKGVQPRRTGGADLMRDLPLLVTPIQSLMQAVPSRDQLKHMVRELNIGDELESEKLIVS
jgi:transcription-repair coupling factor (superfamily II helicase)